MLLHLVLIHLTHMRVILRPVPMLRDRFLLLLGSIRLRPSEMIGVQVHGLSVHPAIVWNIVVVHAIAFRLLNEDLIGARVHHAGMHEALLRVVVLVVLGPRLGFI